MGNEKTLEKQENTETGSNKKGGVTDIRKELGRGLLRFVKNFSKKHKNTKVFWLFQNGHL